MKKLQFVNFTSLSKYSNNEQNCESSVSTLILSVF